jgi:hypothetical protein
VLVQFIAEGRDAEPVASGVETLAVRTAGEMAELWSRGAGR